MLKIIGDLLLTCLILVAGVQIGYRFFGRYSWRVYHVDKGPWYALLLLYPATFYGELLKLELPKPHASDLIVPAQPPDSPDNRKHREDYSLNNAMLWPLRLALNVIMAALIPALALLLFVMYSLCELLVNLTVHRLDDYLAARHPKQIIQSKPTPGEPCKEPPQTLDALRPTVGWENPTPPPPPSPDKPGS